MQLSEETFTSISGSSKPLEKMLLKLALLRVCLVGFIFVFNLVLFYLCYDFNFLYAAGIGAIALLFCKVNSDEVKEKLEIENDSKNLN